jgi:hypothetical protein
MTRERMQEHTPHRIRRQVKLPGGRQIEVVYLDSRREEPPPESSHAAADIPRASSSETPVAATPWAGDLPTSAPNAPLHVCTRCGGTLVSPLDWMEESPGRWRVSMRCPDCDLMREGVFGQALVERLDEELDRATGALLEDLKQLTHANMVDEIECFSRALQLDLIGPSDF